MLCSVLKFSDHTPCKNGVRTGCSVVRDGYVYEMCLAHFNRADEIGPADLNPERRRVHHNIAVSNIGGEITHTDLRTGAEYTQDQLDLGATSKKEESTMDPITMHIRRVVKYDDHTMLALPGGTEWTGTIEEFKALAADLLTKDHNYHIKGFAARVDNVVYYVDRHKSVRVSGVVIHTANRSNRTR